MTAEIISYGLLFLSLAATGAFAGLVAGMLGVGGGIVVVPALFFVFESLGYGGDKLMQVCVATSGGTVIFNSIRSVLMHHKHGAVNWSVLKTWGPAIAIGAVFGMLSAAHLRSNGLSVVFGCVGILIGIYMLVSRPEWKLADQMPHWPLASLYGATIGYFSAMMGIGGGSFGVPALTLYGQKLRNAVATAAGFGLLISAPAFLGFLISGIGSAGRPPYSTGYVNLPALALIVLFSMTTVPIGVHLAHRLPTSALKRIFSLVISATALHMLIKGLSGL